MSTPQINTTHLKAFIIALQEVDKLDCEKRAKKIIEEMFSKQLQDLGLPQDSFRYHFSDKNDIQLRHFSLEDTTKRNPVKFLVITGRNKKIIIQARLDLL
ncbi:MAG: hypothetical protein WCJ74_02140 [bacterium]